MARSQPTLVQLSTILSSSGFQRQLSTFGSPPSSLRRRLFSSFHCYLRRASGCAESFTAAPTCQTGCCPSNCDRSPPCHRQEPAAGCCPLRGGQKRISGSGETRYYEEIQQHLGITSSHSQKVRRVMAAMWRFPAAQPHHQAQTLYLPHHW